MDARERGHAAVADRFGLLDPVLQGDDAGFGVPGKALRPPEVGCLVGLGLGIGAVSADVGRAPEMGNRVVVVVS